MKEIDLKSIDSKNIDIVNNEYFRVHYMVLDAGKCLLSKTDQAMAIIEVIEGRITFVFDDSSNTYVLKSNTLLEFDARKQHTIIAHEDSKMLLTIVPIK